MLSLSTFAIILPLLFPIAYAYAQSDQLQNDAQQALPVFQSVFTWIHDVSEHIMGTIFGMAGVTVEPWLVSLAAFGLGVGLVLAIVSKIIKHLGYAVIASIAIAAIIFFFPLSSGH